MTHPVSERLETGIEGLDTVLHGGLIPERGYLVTGPPGGGKTILGCHFLATGARRGESCLYVHLEESEEDIRSNAAAVDLDLDGVDFLDLSPSATEFTDGQTYGVFAPDEVEGPGVQTAISDQIEAVDPDRTVIDPMTRLRQLAPDEYQFRKQVNSFMEFVKGQDGTVLFTSQATEGRPDDDLQFLSDGVVHLDRSNQGRTIAIPKYRGSDTESGEHTVRITGDGMSVYPQLMPGDHNHSFDSTTTSSGIPEIDELLGGGLERGTVTILSGPTGAGKTTLGSQFLKEAAGRGERSVLYTFEESTRTLLERSQSVNIPIAEMVDSGTLTVEAVEPLNLTPAEFASKVRHEVEGEGAQMVMIDGADGYRLSLQGRGADIKRELHSLCRYLRNMGATVILVDSIDAVTGEFRATNAGVSYLADNIVFLRYLEFEGYLRKAIGVLKKRTSGFERTLREFEITAHGIKVGEPLTNLRGILSGSPERVPASQQSGGETEYGGVPTTDGAG